MKITLKYVDGDSVYNKVGAIKMIRGLTGFGLKESKELVEQLPQTISVNATPAQVKTFKNGIAENGVFVSFDTMTVGKVQGWINEAIDAHEFELAQTLINFLRERNDSPEPLAEDQPLNGKEVENA